jgi:hypothetical protein
VLESRLQSGSSQRTDSGSSVPAPASARWIVGHTVCGVEDKRALQLVQQLQQVAVVVRKAAEPAEQGVPGGVVQPAVQDVDVVRPDGDRTDGEAAVVDHDRDPATAGDRSRSYSASIARTCASTPWIVGGLSVAVGVGKRQVVGVAGSVKRRRQAAVAELTPQQARHRFVAGSFAQAVPR